MWAVLQAQRAEVDCGSLVDELQQLIQAKADVAQQRADLDRCVTAASLCHICNVCSGCRDAAVDAEMHLCAKRVSAMKHGARAYTSSL